jgi:hypothetical protein
MISHSLTSGRKVSLREINVLIKIRLDIQLLPPLLSLPNIVWSDFLCPALYKGRAVIRRQVLLMISSKLGSLIYTNKDLTPQTEYTDFPRSLRIRIHSGLAPIDHYREIPFVIIGDLRFQMESYLKGL